MKKLPVIITPRFILREIEELDASDMFEYSHLPYVGPNAGWQPHCSVSETRAIIKLFQGKKKYGQLGVFAIVIKETGKMVGTVELHTYVEGHKADLGYTVNPAYWGKGVAVEVSKYIVAWGFETLGLKRIEASAFTSNHQSKRVCEKLGFRYEGLKKKGYLSYDGSINDIDCYALTDDEYFRLRDEARW